jgi:hypothetical protein
MGVLWIKIDYGKQFVTNKQNCKCDKILLKWKISVKPLEELQNLIGKT